MLWTTVRLVKHEDKRGNNGTLIAIVQLQKVMKFVKN